jgi:hypothetical protein
MNYSTFHHFGERETLGLLLDQSANDKHLINSEQKSIF